MPQLVDTTIRLLSQEPLAGKVPTGDVLRIASILDRAGFACLEVSGGGVFDAAEETNKFAIGVDANQNWVKPGFILTSMLKRIDVAVYNTIGDLVGGKFSGGIRPPGRCASQPTSPRRPRCGDWPSGSSVRRRGWTCC